MYSNIMRLLHGLIYGNDWEFQIIAANFVTVPHAGGHERPRIQGTNLTFLSLVYERVWNADDAPFKRQFQMNRCLTMMLSED